MSGNRKPAVEGAKSMLKPCLLGMGVSAAACAALLLLLAGLMTWCDIPPRFIDPLTIAAAAAATFVGGYICARGLRENGLFAGMGCGAVLFALLFLCSLPVTGTSFSPILPIKLLSMLLAGAAGGVFGVNRRAKRR